MREIHKFIIFTKGWIFQREIAIVVQLDTAVTAQLLLVMKSDPTKITSSEIRRKIFGLVCPYNFLHEQYSWVNTFFYAHGWIILLPNDIFKCFKCRATRKKGSHFTFLCHQRCPKWFQHFSQNKLCSSLYTALHR